MKTGSRVMAYRDMKGNLVGVVKEIGRIKEVIENQVRDGGNNVLLSPIVIGNGFYLLLLKQVILLQILGNFLSFRSNR